MALLWTTAVGILLIGWTLREVFMDLFQPSAAGSLSSFMGRRMFEISKRVPSTLSFVGPLCIVVVIVCWVFLIASGFALVYWGRFPGSFNTPRGPWPDAIHRFWTVLYFSLSSLTTLASGELSPRGDWVRILAAVESLIGVSLVTASATWIILVYPALGRMRCLSRRAWTVVRAHRETGIDPISQNAENLLNEMAVAVIRVRVDLIYFPLIYYFHTETQGTSLAKSLTELFHLAERSADKQPETVRLSAAVLRIALGDIAETLRSKFLRNANGNSPQSVFEAVSRDHLENKSYH